MGPTGVHPGGVGGGGSPGWVEFRSCDTPLVNSPAFPPPAVSSRQDSGTTLGGSGAGVTSSQSGVKSSWSSAWMCTTSCRLPASARTTQDPENSDLIPLREVVASVRSPPLYANGPGVDAGGTVFTGYRGTSLKRNAYSLRITTRPYAYTYCRVLGKADFV